MDREKDIVISRAEIKQLFTGAGFHRVGICNSDSLAAPLAADPEIAGLGRGSYVMAALSCYRGEPDDLSSPGDPHGLIAPFARRNYYREAVRRIKGIVREIEKITRLSRGELRIFCNSRFPEKALAAAGGLGFYGKNGLIISPGLGSLFIIAGLFLPLCLSPDESPPAWREAGRICGSCTACLEACPVGAIPEPGRLDRKRCLQALATRAVVFSPQYAEAWSVRLYGCQTCQAVCPHNRNLSLESFTGLGDLGPSISLLKVLSRSEQGVKELFKGTQLGLSWVAGKAIQRNAILAAGHRRDPVLLPMLEAYFKSDHKALKAASEWALARIDH